MSSVAEVIWWTKLEKAGYRVIREPWPERHEAIPGRALADWHSTFLTDAQRALQTL